MHYYIIEKKIKQFQDELDPTLYNYQKLNEEQIVFYNNNPTCTLHELLNLQMSVSYSFSVSELKEHKKIAFDIECQNEILQQYPLYKQINISTLNGYSDTDFLVMKSYISNQRNKLAILNEMINSVETQEELDSINWETSLEDLIDYIILSGSPNSLLVAKNKKIKELGSWVFGVQSAGYTDAITNITLAAKDADIDAFSKDLTGLNSVLLESTSNETVDVDPYWTFIDINGSAISTLTPVEYISLLNRYFIALRTMKIQYSTYMYYIYAAQSVEDLGGITFGS